MAGHPAQRRRKGPIVVDIAQQIHYWRSSAEEDWDVACHLLESRRMRHGLFFAHLAVEKLLKAHVCLHTQDIAPRTHNLVRLAELAGLALTAAQTDVLAEMNEFNIEGRYPGLLLPAPSVEEAREHLARAEEIRQWLLETL
jgi:HEPN domain-containing protein